MNSVPISTDRFMANLAVGLDIPGPGIRITTTEVITTKQVELTTTIYFEHPDVPAGSIVVAPIHGVMELTASEFKDWKGYDLDLFGTNFDPTNLPPGTSAPHEAPTWTVNWADEGLKPTTLLLWRQRARHQNSPLRSELLFFPDGQERCSVRVLEPDATYSRAAAARAFRGVALLRGHSLLPAVERTRLGRKPYDRSMESRIILRSALTLRRSTSPFERHNLRLQVNEHRRNEPINTRLTSDDGLDDVLDRCDLTFEWLRTATISQLEEKLGEFTPN